jgi:hypothetical protein
MNFQEYLNENFTYKTEKDGTGHTHDLSLDADGSGETTSTNNGDDHRHRVFEWMVQPAHGHIHNIDLS